MKHISAVCWQTAPHHEVLTSKPHCRHGVCGVICSAFWPPYPRESQTIFSQYFTGLCKCFSANCKHASTCLFFSIRVVYGERAYRPWWLLIVFLEIIVQAASRSLSTSGHQLFQLVLWFSMPFTPPFLHVLNTSSFLIITDNLWTIYGLISSGLDTLLPTSGKKVHVNSTAAGLWPAAVSSWDGVRLAVGTGVYEGTNDSLSLYSNGGDRRGVCTVEETAGRVCSRLQVVSK